MKALNPALATVIGALILALSGCGSPANADKAAAQNSAPAIEVVKSKAYQVQPWKTYTTRIEAPEEVTLRPRISGVIEAVHFVEGQNVEQGDLLVSLDGRQLSARVDQLKAELDSSEAAARQAQNEYERAQRLIRQQAISEEQAELRLTAAQQQKANVSSLKARLAQAKLDLSYTDIRSPIDGTISRAEITTGNTVTANQSLLTTITSDGQRHAYFNMEERSWYRYYGTRDKAISAPVVAQLIGEEGYSHRGVIDFVDNGIDVNSGTLRIRAVLSDEQGRLLPGAFARIRIAVADASAKVLVPDSAIATDLENKFVLTLDENNQATYTQVSLGERFGAYRVIEKGLEQGLNVVANGTAKVGPGMAIAPVEIEMDTRSLQLTLDARSLNNSRTASVAQ
ncbi:efflux RND transporter periplasmic adaptor subunit [Marinobacter sp.]|uniref:efflux RND transporter periplasmic adaptor subunit n=1 Tax=Marinobacter sp. TaxID=50741 RepID=UPI003B52DD4A